MKKRCLALLLALCLVAGMVPVTASAEDTIEPGTDSVVKLTLGSETTYYESFTEAWADATRDGTTPATLELLAEKTASFSGQSLYLNEDKTVTLTGTGTLKYEGSQNNGALFVEKGTLDVTGGTIIAPNCGLSVSGGAINMSGGTIQAPTGIELQNGNLTFSGGTIENATTGILCVLGNATISGGAITATNNGISIYDQGTPEQYGKIGTVTVQDGANITCTGENGSGIAIAQSGYGDTITSLSKNKDNLVMTGGTVTSSGFGINANGNAKVNISGGSVTAKGTGLYLVSYSEAAVSGGTITSESSGNGVEIMIGSTATVSGGTIQGQDGLTVFGSSTEIVSSATITDGTIIGTVRSGVSVGSNSTVTISNGNVKGSSNGIFTDEGSKAVISGGTVKGENHYALFASTGTVTLSGGTFESDSWLINGENPTALLETGYGYFTVDGAPISEDQMSQAKKAIVEKKDSSKTEVPFGLSGSVREYSEDRSTATIYLSLYEDDSLPQGAEVAVACTSVDGMTIEKKTDPSGRTYWTATVPAGKTYEFTATYAGDDTHYKHIATCTVKVTSVVMTLTADKTTLTDGGDVVLKAEVTNLPTNGTIKLICENDITYTQNTVAETQWTVNLPATAATYRFVAVCYDMAGRFEAQSEVCVITVGAGAAETNITLTATPSSLTGAGQVILTVGGVPEGGETYVDNVEFNSNVRPVRVEGTNTWTVDIPSDEKTYTFYASYPGDSTHMGASAECTVTVTASSGTPSTPDTPTPTPTPTPGTPSGGNSGTSTTPSPKPVDEVNKTPTVTGGTASTIVSSSEGNSLVAEAQKPTTDEVTVKVEPKGDADTVNVELPASTVKGIGAANSDLTVETPVADVTLPSESLTQLGQSAGKIIVTAQKKDDTVAITIKKDSTVVQTLSQPMKAAIPAANATNGLVAVIVNEDGTETIIKKSVAGNDEVAMQLKGSATVKLVDNTKSFTDTPNDWSKAGIDFASSRELFQGTSETTFSPSMAMTRGMIVTVLHRLEDTPAGGNVNFDDVKPGDYFADAVAWANENGIANGTGSGFNPDGSVTRQDLAAFLFRYAKAVGLNTTGRSSLNGFTDGSAASSYSRDALEWCLNTGIIKGASDTTLNPLGNASRAEVATMLQRFVQYINK